MDKLNDKLVSGEIYNVGSTKENFTKKSISAWTS